MESEKEAQLKGKKSPTTTTSENAVVLFVVEIRDLVDSGKV